MMRVPAAVPQPPGLKAIFSRFRVPAAGNGPAAIAYLRRPVQAAGLPQDQVTKANI
jgi:hypothetical protein